MGCEWEGRREACTGALVVSSYLGGGGGDRYLGSCNGGPAAGGRVHGKRSMPRRPRGKRNVPDQQHFLARQSTRRPSLELDSVSLNRGDAGGRTASC